MKLTLRNICTMFILLGAASNAYAALILDSNDQLTGATNISVDGTLFNVKFLNGTCVSLFNGCENSDFTFTTQGQASNAANALLAQVFGPNTLRDQDPSSTLGCEDLTECYIWTVYKQSNEDIEVVGTRNLSGLTADQVLNADLWWKRDTTSKESEVYARWTIATAVSAPSSLAIFTLGLLGLASRRFKK